MPVGIGLDEVFVPGVTIPVVDDGFGALERRNPVHQLVAFSVDVVTDRIDDQLAHSQPARIACGSATQDGLERRYPTPYRYAGVNRIAFVRIELASNC